MTYRLQRGSSARHDLPVLLEKLSTKESPSENVLMHLSSIGLRIPNVHLTRTIPLYFRDLTTLAQPPATEFPPLPRPALSPPRYHHNHHLQNSSPYPQKSATMEPSRRTDILPVDAAKLGNITFQPSAEGLVDEWNIEYLEGLDTASLKRAAKEILETDIPVAFPTETVYGLGADATRSSAVRAIFTAKGRPADNPLIVHVCSIAQLESLLSGDSNDRAKAGSSIPSIYHPLIRRFWPGPLTIILPLPSPSPLAPEVTASLRTFGARMPRSLLALSLIQLSGVPLAAPSANASTRPSPTAAEHVYDDLHTRITTIIDGGPCEVGVESTVVDGLSHPPSILRPGGVTVEQLRQCEGWEDVVVGYKDAAQGTEDGKGEAPRAPGMKYRHYSPKARVVLYEAGTQRPERESVVRQAEENRYGVIGVIRTGKWPRALGLPVEAVDGSPTEQKSKDTHPLRTSSTLNRAANGTSQTPSQSNLIRSLTQHQIPHATHYTGYASSSSPEVWDIDLGSETDGVARGLFSALRELDKKGVGVIFVEGIDDRAGDDIAAAVMNRLRKAAEVRVE